MRFLTLQLPGNKSDLLSDVHLKTLITPVGEYAAGWGTAERPWGKGRVLHHSGCNTMWYTLVWVAPKIDRAFIVSTNSFDQNSHRVCDTMIGWLIQIDAAP